MTKANFTQEAILNIYHAVLKYQVCWVCSDGQMYRTETDCNRHVKFRKEQENPIMYCRIDNENFPKDVKALWKIFYNQSVDSNIEVETPKNELSIEDAKALFEARFGGEVKESPKQEEKVEEKAEEAPKTEAKEPNPKPAKKSSPKKSK